jgi:hypothetical protein
MQFDNAKLNAAIETTKAKAANNARRTRAIEKAAAAIVAGEIRVHIFGASPWS